MADVIGAIRTNTAEIDQAKQQLIDIQSAMSEPLSTLESSTADGTISGPDGKSHTTVLAEKQKMAAELAEQTANQQLAATADFERYSNELVGSVKKANDLRDQKLREIQAINSSSNPLEHILGLVTIPFKAAQANDAANLADARTHALEQVNKLIQSSAKTTAIIQTRVTESTNASVAEALANDQMAVAAKAKIYALQTGAHQIKDILSMSDQQLRNKIKEFDIGEAVSMRQFREAQMDQMMAIRKEAADNKNAAKLSIDSINYALLVSGKDPIPEEQVPLVAQQLNKPGEFGDLLRTLFTRGTLGRLSEDGLVQGDTPMEARQYREQLNTHPRSEAERDTLAVIDGLMDSAPGLKTAKTNEERVNASNVAVSARLSQDENNINTSPGSLAKPMSWATMATSDAFRNNRVFKDIISPQITDNISTNAIEPVELFKRLGTALKAKQITIPEMKDFYQTYGAQSILLNNQVGGLHKFTGLRQTKFIAHLPQPARKFGSLGEFKLSGFDPITDRATTALNRTLDLVPIASTVNKFKTTFSSQSIEPVDVMNDARLTEAITNWFSGELREPDAAK